MRSISVWTSLVVLLAVSSSRAEEAPPVPKAARDNIVLADLGLHVLGAGYQRTLTPRFAMQLDLEWYTPWTQNTNFAGLSGSANQGDTNGIVVRERAFFYLTEDAPTGLWLSPFVQEGLVTATKQGRAVVGGAAAVGGSVGYSWLFFDVVHLALGVGAQGHMARYGSDDTAPSFARLYPELDASLGYAF